MSRSRPRFFRLRLIAAGLAVLLAALFAFNSSPAQAQPLAKPVTHLMERLHLGFYLWWGESPGATGYEIEISEESGGSWSSWTDVPFSGTTQPALATGLTHGTKYRWRVRATDGSAYSAWTTHDGHTSDTRTARSFSAGKANPPILRAVAAGPEQVTATWEPGPVLSGATVTGYAVRYRWENEQNQLVTENTEIVAADTRTLTVTGLTPGVEYEMWVAAYVGTSRGAGSRILSAFPETGSTPTVTQGSCNHADSTPPGLSQITSFTPTHNSITLHWNSPVYGTQVSGRKDMITNFILWVKDADNSVVQTVYTTAEAWEPATYKQKIFGLSESTTYRIDLYARTITACYSGASSVQVTTTAYSGQQGLRLGVIERPLQEQPDQQQQEAQQEQPDEQQQPELQGQQGRPDLQEQPNQQQQPDPQGESGQQQQPGSQEQQAEPQEAPESETAPETESEPVTDDVVARYDANGDGTIDVTEYRAAANDYAADKLSYDELLKVIKAYLSM